MPADDGLPPTQVWYSERLQAPWWVWLFPPLAAMSIGAAYFVALGPLAGGAIALVVAVVGVILIRRGQKRILVHSGGLQVGRACLPWEFVGQVRSLDEDQTKKVTGPYADAQAFLVYRPSYAGCAVVVGVTDTRDPHTYWLVSTKEPQRLRSAIVEAHATVSNPPAA